MQYFHQITEIKVGTASRLNGWQPRISLGRNHPKVSPNESKHSHKEQYGEPSGYDEIGESFFPLRVWLDAVTGGQHTVREEHNHGEGERGAFGCLQRQRAFHTRYGEIGGKSGKKEDIIIATSNRCLR